MTFHRQRNGAVLLTGILLDWKQHAGLTSPTWPIVCTLTVCVALQLDSHNVMPLLRLSNYYEVSQRLHRYARRFAGRVEAEWEACKKPLPESLLMARHDSAHMLLLTCHCWLVHIMRPSH